MGVWIVGETDTFQPSEHPFVGIAESPMHTPTIVVVFGRAPVMSDAGGAFCIQHCCMPPLITAIVSWLSNCSMKLEYRGASCTTTLRLHTAVPKRDLGSAVVLEHEISYSFKKFQKFQVNKLKFRGWQSKRRRFWRPIDLCHPVLRYTQGEPKKRPAKRLYKVCLYPRRSKNTFFEIILSFWKMIIWF